MWKPGQCITIRGIQYRVKKNPPFTAICLECELACKYVSLCYKLCGSRITGQIPEGCNLIKVKPYAKSKSAKSTRKSQ